MLRSPNFETYSAVIDEVRRIIADPSLPEHEDKADQYTPAIVIEAAENETIILVTGDRKLWSIVHDSAEQEVVSDRVPLRDPLPEL